ncbi:MAG: PAS domain-containing protein, partial [Eggerthellaceae bacterium]|nr:PAS domain-containing protein [Eggerthellaceae bacterium]
MCIYLVGLTDEQADIIKGIPELPGFCRNVEKSAHPDDALASSADVVILSADGESVRDCVRKVAGALKPGAQLILIAPHGTLSLLGEDAQVLADVWFAPLDGAELAFRFSHWQEQRRTADDLWETRQFLDATIDSIPSLVWYKTHDGVHEKVNSSFCKTVGKTKEQVQGQRHAYIWDVEEDDPACIESENQVMASGKTCVSEEVVQTGEGTRLLTTYKSPLYDIDGSVMGTVGVGIDITQERAYENDLIEKTRTLETIFTSLDCGVLTHSLDGTQILGINQTALDILGFESE